MDEYNQELVDYFKKWQVLSTGRSNQALFVSLKPTALGWKVADAAEYTERYAALRPHCDRIVETWMNGRWIAQLHLKDSALAGGVTILKLMQRRPDSDDPIGLDHVDFYSPLVNDNVLDDDAGLQWSRESNDVIAGYEWLSIWFDGTEAKLKAGTVLDIVQAELAELNQQIKA